MGSSTTRSPPGPWPSAASAAAGLPENLRAIILGDRARWTDTQIKDLRNYFVEHAYSKTKEVSAPLQTKLAEAEEKRKQLEKQFPTSMVFREKSGEPKPSYFLKRGEYDQRGEKVGRGVPAFLPPLPPACAGQPPGAGPLAGRAQPSADRTRGRQPLLAPGLRDRARQDGRGLRRAGRAPQPSRAAGLAGRPVPRGSMGRQAVHEAAGDVGRVPAVVAGHAGEAGEGPRQPAPGAGPGTGSTPRCSATRRSSPPA